MVNRRELFGLAGFVGVTGVTASFGPVRATLPLSRAHWVLTAAAAPR